MQNKNIRKHGEDNGISRESHMERFSRYLHDKLIRMPTNNGSAVKEPYSTINRRRKRKKKEIENLKKYYRWDLKYQEDDRRIVQHWSEERIKKMQGLRKFYVCFWIYSFDLSTLRCFIGNFNFMVIIQMIIAGLAVWLFQYTGVAFDYHVSLFVSPIVFPLAFSINTDFQRREKVLDDLASFKSTALSWFFCMREWRSTAGLDVEWLEAIKMKIRSMMFMLREYLFVEEVARRDVIARYIYEDLSDISQFIEEVRISKLPANTAIIARLIHLLNCLTLSFERLRVVREYRSPRSIRSFNKVLILLLPIILCPYFAHLGQTHPENPWGSYVLAVLVAGVFAALQSVQDKLDNPFDGMGEDDINLDTIYEWATDSLKIAAERNYNNVGRFHPFDPNVGYCSNEKREVQETEKDMDDSIKTKASEQNSSVIQRKERWSLIQRELNRELNKKKKSIKFNSLRKTMYRQQQFDSTKMLKKRQRSTTLQNQNARDIGKKSDLDTSPVSLKPTDQGKLIISSHNHKQPEDQEKCSVIGLQSFATEQQAKDSILELTYISTEQEMCIPASPATRKHLSEGPGSKEEECSNTTNSRSPLKDLSRNEKEHFNSISFLEINYQGKAVVDLQDVVVNIPDTCFLDNYHTSELNNS